MATTTDNINIKINVDASKSEQSTTSYKQRIKELKEEMVQLEVETNGLSKATAEQRARYDELQQQAGQLTDALDNVNSRIKASADDYQNFNAAMEGMKGITAFGQGVAGVTSLLGINSDAVTRSIQVMMGLQSVMSSLNTVQQLFNKDSKLMIMLQNLKVKGAKTEAVAMQGAAVATTAEAGATTAATAATRSFTAALMSNPFGLIAVALATVTTALIGLTGAMDDDTESVEKNTEATDNNTTSWTNNAAARREALKGYASLLSDIENKGISQLDREGALLEFVTGKLGVQVNSVQEASKVYEDFKKSTDGITQSMEVFYNEGTQINNEFTTLKDAALSHANALRMLKDAQEDYKIAAESGVGQEILDDLDEEIQKWEANSRYAEQFLKILEQKTVGYYKNVLKERQKALEQAKEDNKALGFQADFETYEEAYAKLYKDIADTRKKVDDTSFKESEEVFNTYIKNRRDAMKKAEDDFLEEQSAMLHSLGLTEEEALNNEAYQEWLDVKETALSQFLETTQKEIDEANKVNERKEIDAQNRIDNAVLATRLANVKEGSEEFWEVQQEIEKERYEQEMEALRRQLEDEQITKDEYAAIEKEKKAEHEANLRDITQARIDEELRLEEMRVQATEQMFSGLHSVLGSLEEASLADETKNEKEKLQTQKKYAIAGLLVNLAESGVALATSIPKTLEAYAEIPFAGPIIAAVQIAAMTASIIAQIAKINQYQQKINSIKAARGAYVVGPSHAEGGVPYELEGGEAVLNKRAMSIPAYRNMASAMNVATGGVAFPGTNPNMALTAMVDERAVDVIVRRTIAGITSIPVVVSEELITNAQRNVGVSVERSRI